MNILIYLPDQKALEIISFCLESELGASIHVAETIEEAKAQIGNSGSLSLAVIHHGKEGLELIHFLENSGSSLPLVVISQKNDTSDSITLGYKHILGHLQISMVPEKLLAVIHQKFGPTLKVPGPDEYCRINADLLVRIGTLSGDIYIRLSNSNFVKLFKTGTTFSQDDLNKIVQSKKVRSLYIKKSDTSEFINKFKEDLLRLTEEIKEGDASIANQVSEAHELVHELSRKIGFSPEIQSLAAQTVRLTLKSIGSSPKITKILANSQLKGQNYISNHSVLLANISCSIAAQMEWPSTTTFHKLVLASLFHDFTFQDPNLAKISDLPSLEKAKHTLSDDQYEEVINHPLKCAEIIRSLREIPGDVEFLVFQHHERPDGSGFPKGLRSHQIVALSALFIIAHEILDQLMALEDRFNLNVFLKSTEHVYDTGAFKKIWKVLSENS